MAGSDQIAGRATMVADWLNPQEVREQRLWIDNQTGVILRRQVYSANDGETLLEDILFVRVNYDVDIPPELFDPQTKMAGNFYETSLGMQGPTDSTRAGFDPAGTATDRPRLEKTAPVTSIDLAREPLTFQYPQGFQEASLGQNETAVISLFAGKSYLGELAYLDPWESVCDRSPDGTRIAFLYRSAWQRFPRSARSPGPLQWVDLTDLGNVHKLLPGYRVESFAFSPDSQRIAVFGQGPALSQGTESSQGLYVVDLASGQETKVTNMAYATSLLWSPDGEYLAMVGMMDNAANIEAIIVKIPSGEVVYHGRLDARILSFQRALAGITLPEDWPAKDWGSFPVQDDGLARCVAQPGG